MIKKDLKTLSEIQNPTKKDWRIYLTDGSFIDVEHHLRDEMIMDLYRTGRLGATVNMTPIRGLEQINVNINVIPTGTEELSIGKRFWNMFKKDVLYWNKSLFWFMLSLVIVGGWVGYTLKHFIVGPIILDSNKETLSFLEGGNIFVGFLVVIALGGSLMVRITKLLPYITVWLKLVFFIIFLLLVFLTIETFSTKLSEKILDFTSEHLFTEKEINILKLLTNNENNIL